MYNFHFLKSNYPSFILKTEGRIDKFLVTVGSSILGVGNCHSYLHGVWSWRQANSLKYPIIFSHFKYEKNLRKKLGF